MTAREKISSLLTSVNGLTGATDTNLTDGIRRLGAGYPKGYTDNDVVFIDYDGTVVYSCSAEDLLGMDALPPNPSHPGLTAQGWNWTLADAKNYMLSHLDLVIGQNYVTSDGKTRIYVNIPGYGLIPYCNVGIGVNGTAYVDWGDGSAQTMLTGTSTSTVKFASHSYSISGNYANFVITITVQSGKIGFCKLPSSSYPAIFCADTSATALEINQGAYSCVQKIELGDNIDNIASYAFRNLSLLSSISIPAYQITFGIGITFARSRLTGIVFSRMSLFGEGFTYTFESHTLRYISFPKDTTFVTAYAWEYCYSLMHTPAVVPASNEIGSAAFISCECLRVVQIPNTVTSIGDNAFAKCTSLLAVSFFGFTNVPTLANVNAFDSSPCVFAVPSSLVNTWRSATNWGTYASRIVGVF